MSAPEELCIWEDPDTGKLEVVGPHFPHHHRYVRASPAPQAGVPRDVEADFVRVHCGGRNANKNEHGDWVYPSIRDAWAGWRSAAEFYAAPSADAGVREPLLESLLMEARGHLRGYSMSMLARSRDRLLAAIDAALSPAAQQPTETKHD